MSESPDILETLKAEYFALAHAVQTGVKSTMEHDRAHHPARDQDRDEYGAKHLRTGVNMAICEHSALVRIMLDKGLITQIEYYTELNKLAFPGQVETRYFADPNAWYLKTDAPYMKMASRLERHALASGIHVRGPSKS